MVAHVGAWFAALVVANGSQWLLAPDPTPDPTSQPTPGPSSGFEWDKIHPDPSAVPKSDLFYTICNAALFLGVVAAIAGGAAGAIAFGTGPIFGAHIISDRGKSMMWKNGLVAIIIGSLTSIVAWLLKV